MVQISCWFIKVTNLSYRFFFLNQDLDKVTLIHLPLSLFKSLSLSFLNLSLVYYGLVWFSGFGFAIHLFRELGVCPALFRSLDFAGCTPMVLCALYFLQIGIWI